MFSWSQFTFAALAACCSIPGTHADQHIVVAPATNDTSLPERMLLFIPGGDVPNDRYVATGQAVQRALAKDVRLWVAIPAVLKRLCILSCTTPSLCSALQGDAEAVLKLASEQGWKRGDDSKELWIAGHSLGGVCANTLLQAGRSGSAQPYAGVIVMGSYVDTSGAYDLTHYPTPLLTLNAELDAGSARPGKTNIWFRQFLALEESSGKEKALESKPVIILPKLNHSDFCPGFDVPGDLMAEVDQITASRSIGEAIAAFLGVQVLKTGKSREAYAAKLGALLSWTRELLSPYIKAQEYEVASTGAQGGGSSSPLCEKAQHLIAGLSAGDDAHLQVADASQPELTNLMSCHTNWTRTAGGKLLVHSCSHPEYYANVANLGEITAAREVACKMLSNERVAEQLGTQTAHPSIRCIEGNKYAVQVAESLALPETLARYKKKGRGICLLDDEETWQDIGPLWVFKDRLKLAENSTCLSVASIFLRTALNSSIYPGNHYCKILSPARVLDWMMSDSLKSPTSFAQSWEQPQHITV